MPWYWLICFFGSVLCDNDFCEGNTTCPSVTINSNTVTSAEPTERMTTELMTEEPTTIEMTTTKHTSPKPTSTPPAFTIKMATSAFCWCDVTVNECDLNCCCDDDCSAIQKQVFTTCSTLKPLYDLKSCYASDLFFRKPKSLKSNEENGLFCMVRENQAMMKEFKPRMPIQSIEEFDKELRRQRFVTFPRREPRFIFSSGAYKVGTVVWTIRRGKLQPLTVPQPLSGDLCLSTRAVTFLDEIQTECVVPPISTTVNCSKWVMSTILDIIGEKIITQPQNINTSDIESSLKNCSSLKTCTEPYLFLCNAYPSFNNCVATNMTILLRNNICSYKGAAIEVSFRHNASEGIHSINVRIWTLNTTLLEIKVKFHWLNASETPFKRSGNPGYLSHRPILAGKKVFLSFNDSSKVTREAINMTVNPKGWLTILNGVQEDCSASNRAPILFNDNIKTSCSLKLRRKYFDKNGCLDFQNAIYDYLLGENVMNKTNREVNRFVGCYGNSKVENMGDWVKIIVDSFPLLTTQVSFGKSVDGLWCKGIVSSLYIDIAFSKFGSFAAPQSKIVGVLFRFGNPRMILVRCHSGGCETRASSDSIRLTTFVKFYDLSSPPVREYARPPGLEAKLPHDFFYPFFSGKGNVCFPTQLIMLWVQILHKII